MSMRDSASNQESPGYLSKKVVVNGQTVTLYSSNGQTWLSSPEEIPDVMARLENTRILLNDPKTEKSGVAPKPADAPPAKPASAKYRMRGPKQRPILQQNGAPIRGTPVEPISASSVEVRVVGPNSSLAPVAQRAVQLRSSASSERKKLVAPVASKPTPPKSPHTRDAVSKATQHARSGSVKKRDTPQLGSSAQSAARRGASSSKEEVTKVAKSTKPSPRSAVLKGPKKGAGSHPKKGPKSLTRKTSQRIKRPS